MLGGFLTTVAWVLWLKPLFFDLLEVIPGFLMGLVLTVTFSRRSTHEAKRDDVA